MNRVLGIVNFESNEFSIEGLTNNHNISTLSILGRYKMIDFVLSNMTNSGINNINIYTTKDGKTLFDHVGDGEFYNVNSKRGKLNIYPVNNRFGNIYNNDLFALRSNVKYLLESNYKYVIIAPAYYINKINYKEVLEQHISEGNDITLINSSQHKCKKEFLNATTIKRNKVKQFKGFDKNLGTSNDEHIFLDTYIFNIRTLIELVNMSESVSELYCLKDMVQHLSDKLKIGIFKHNGPLYLVNSLETYLSTNMSLKNGQYINKLNDIGWTLFTKTKDSSPSLYGNNCIISNSLIANGCIIDGQITDSVISRNVTIKKGAKLKNCVVLYGAYISDDVDLEYCIVDKHSSVYHIKNIKGTSDKPIYIKKEGIV